MWNGNSRYVWYQLCSQGDELWLHTLPLEHHCAIILPRVIFRPLGQMVWKTPSTVGWRWSCDSVPCLGVGRQAGSGTSKCLGLRIQITRVCILPSSLAIVHPWIRSANEQSLWLGLILGHCRCALSLPRSVSWQCLANASPSLYHN